MAESCMTAAISRVTALQWVHAGNTLSDVSWLTANSNFPLQTAHAAPVRRYSAAECQSAHTLQQHCQSPRPFAAAPTTVWHTPVSQHLCLLQEHVIAFTQVVS
jgi:hypothetical protein